MKYPNAYKGVSKIMVSQILQIIGVIAVLVGMIGSLSAIGALDFVMAGAFLIAVMASGVIAIIAFIINLVGLAQARKDEGNFTTAMILVLIAIALSVVSTIVTTTNPWLAGWMEFASTIFELSVFECVVIAVMKLADSLGDTSMINFGSKMRILITIGFIIVMVTYILRNNLDIYDVMTTVSSILKLVVYIMYVVFLSKSKKMLRA